ncbi:hypothetical protein [Actinomadura terrae]|uniref:hypothetical protein n=1 Tax=Actinomadura terrae TaxID=604353 RepID=UPI001FA6E9CA|nr:hypothetical protein [Actinomadura terrae]
MTRTVETRHTPASALYRWRWAGLCVILVGAVMDMLDALVTTIAAPSMRHDLGGSTSMIQWVGAADTTAMAEPCWSRRGSG